MDFNRFLSLEFTSDGSQQYAGFVLNTKFVCDNRTAPATMPNPFGNDTSENPSVTTEKSWIDATTPGFTREEELICHRNSYKRIDLDCSKTKYRLSSNGSYHSNHLCKFEFRPRYNLTGVSQKLTNQ